MVDPDKIFGRLGNRMFQGAYIYAQFLDGKIPDIYAQDPKWFQHHSDAIKSLYGANIGPRIDMVAIHVRRGDYVKNPFYVDLTEIDYYHEAIKQFPGEEFLVFSDDIEFCKEYFKEYEFEYCEEKDPIEALNLMASCKGVITANSSYSWWGAYLAELSTGARVISPKLYYTDGIERTKVLDSWTKI